MGVLGAGTTKNTVEVGEPADYSDASCNLDKLSSQTTDRLTAVAMLARINLVGGVRKSLLRASVRVSKKVRSKPATVESRSRIAR